MVTVSIAAIKKYRGSLYFDRRRNTRPENAQLNAETPK